MTTRAVLASLDPLVVGPILVLLSTCMVYQWYTSETYQLKHIPTVGAPGLLPSYLDALRFVRHGHEMVQEGYEKFHGTVFKVPIIGRYLVVLSGSEMYDDIRKATDDQLNFREAISEGLQLDYMIGSQIRTDPFHLPAIRTHLTRNLGARFDDLIDELVTAFAELVPAQTDSKDWIKLPVWSTLTHLFCRTSNRVYVGLPLCRTPDYHQLHVQFSANVISGSRTINMFPDMLRPLVGKWLTRVPENIERLVSHIEPIIQERLQMEAAFGVDWPEKPNDMISWLLAEAKGPQRTAHEIAVQLFAVTFGAVHTTSSALTHAIYDLATYPEYAAPLREEIQGVIEAEGWTKHAQGKMYKLDSFLKESQRLAASSLVLSRLARKDFTFSNGVSVPAGTMIALVGLATHHDPANFEDPQAFRGFRFAEMRGANIDDTKHHMTSLSPEYLVFGAGRTACPGRFFAVNQVKAMLVHILVNYDIKLVDENQRPANVWLGGLCSPHPTAEVLLRKRAAT